MKTTLWLAAVLCLPAFGARFGIEDLGKLVRVADPQISPDGTRIVAVVSRPNYEDNRYDAELVLIETATQKQRVLTHDRRNLSFPRWSPSGDRIAFLAAAGGKPQIFVLPMDGGDAVQATKNANGVQQFAWRPDGGALAFAAADEPAKKIGEERHNDAFEVGNNDFLVTTAPLPTHLWLVPATGGEARRLTSGTWTLPISHPPSSPASPIAWSPDGKSIAFVKVSGPYSGDADQSAVQILDVASGAIRAVTGRTRHEGYPVFSPDGLTLAYWSPRDGETKNVNEIHLVPAKGGDGASLTRGLDRNIVRAIWMPDGQSLLVGGNDGTTTGLWIQPLNGSARRSPLGKVVAAGAFWVDVSVGPRGELALAGSEPLHPSEVYYASSPSGQVKR
ncbi:MAG: hypothetical protein M3Y27_21000, partial [Acidobacteriota bacterium]|nr:hypothetical protein [Acidobacteriota bacterium]